MVKAKQAKHKRRTSRRLTSLVREKKTFSFLIVSLDKTVSKRKKLISFGSKAKRKRSADGSFISIRTGPVVPQTYKKKSNE